MVDLEALRPLSPCYLYDQTTIVAACQTLRQELPGFEFLYSIKANPFPPVVTTVAAQGLGADAASVAEVDLARKAGIAAENIFYSAPGKTERDIQHALDRCKIIADSAHELQLIQQAAAERGVEARVGLRVHPTFSMGEAPAGPSKFGFDLEQLSQLTQLLPTLPNVQVTGLHVHLKSQVLDAATLGTYYRNTMDMALDLQKTCNLQLDFVNFGSGIGTVYDPSCEHPVDLRELRVLAQEVHSLNEHTHARLLIETGRYVTCHAGTFVTPVVDRKVSHGTTYLVVQSGMGGFLRPAVAHLLRQAAPDVSLPGMEPLYTNGREFDVRILNEASEQENVTIVGSLCTALDVIAENVTVNKAHIGDLVAVSNAGSYAYTLSPTLFAGLAAPQQFLVGADGTII